MAVSEAQARATAKYKAKNYKCSARFKKRRVRCIKGASGQCAYEYLHKESLKRLHRARNI